MSGLTHIHEIFFNRFVTPSQSFQKLFTGIRKENAHTHRHKHAHTHTELLMLKVYFGYRCNNKRPFKSDLKIFRRNWLQH